MPQALTAYLRSVLGAPAPRPPHNFPSSTQTPLQNFQTMRLLKRTYTVDGHGRWWRIETRQCPFTGVVLRLTIRITE